MKVSTQALFLQIAAEKEWGPGQHSRLDHLTVALAHPDAIAAVLNPISEITAHFATSPFHEAEMKAGLKTVTSGYQIMGGEVSNGVCHDRDVPRRQPQRFMPPSSRRSMRPCNGPTPTSRVPPSSKWR